MDQFIANTQVTNCAPPAYTGPGLVLNYYDGNTVTALWNYAQHFAMNDNSYGTTFGPSAPGALNLVSGQTHTLTDQSSVLRFIEDNWKTGRIGGGSFDALAGSLSGLFDFSHGGPGAQRAAVPQPDDRSAHRPRGEQPGLANDAAGGRGRDGPAAGPAPPGPHFNPG
jgi:hypothetical protein